MLYWKSIGDRHVISRDARKELFSFSQREFADIAYASTCQGDEIILTAARREADRASVDANRKGNYHAYRVSGSAIEQLTDEYTNTAIPLPGNGGIAYSNGGGLVVVVGSRRQVHKTGRFSWGPVSLSCNDSGSLIALTKWKGDDRKLAYLEMASGRFQLSRFSFFSYVLFEQEIAYVLSSDLMAMDVASGKSRSLTPAAVRRKLLEQVGLADRPIDSVLMKVGKLSVYRDALVGTLSVQDAKTYDHLWHGVITLPYAGRMAELLYVPTKGWYVDALQSAGDGLLITLHKYKNASLVESKAVGIGSAAAPVEACWNLVASSRLPETGFQFLPGS